MKDLSRVKTFLYVKPALALAGRFAQDSVLILFQACINEWLTRGDR